MRITNFAIILLFAVTAGPAMASTTTSEQIQSSAEQFLEAFSEAQANEGFTVSHDTGQLDANLHARV